ncbi:hemoblobin-interacting domain-containing protein [Paenibacillus humicus]|uniref:hemoblobin-interacting domain-containing protein n=1 Tax=Paenibacillus humicus TaxID=412861 RepID=UPI000FD7DE99
MLQPDGDDNTAGRAMVISFEEDSRWRAAITAVSVNGTYLDAGSYHADSPGMLEIGAGAFPGKGVYTVNVEAKGYRSVQVRQQVGEWMLTWSDEFDGNAAQPDTNGVDLSKWGYQLGNGSDYGVADWGNNEQQFYRKENLKVENGSLVIEARKESVNGKPYTSGRIWTSPTFSQAYGKFEARMKLPAGQGLWPAFWLMPKDSVYGTWAASGEIDIMEARGRLLNEVGGTLHYGKPSPNNRYTGKTYTFPEGEDITGFHTYGVEWEPGEIRWYVDGKVYQTQNRWDSQGAGQPDKYAFPAPFDQPFYIILNMAVGGNYDGNRLPEDSALPARMEVDYVRAYEIDGRPYRTPQEPVAEREPVPADAKLPVNGSWIYDETFEHGLKDIAASGTALDPLYWNFLHTPDYGGAGSASIETVDGRKMAKIAISSGGVQNYALQLIQYATLVKGHAYKLSFDAKAAADRTIAVKMGGDEDNGWAVYTDQFSPALGTSLQHYEYRFLMNGDTDSTARLEFNAGLNASAVWIGGVKLEEIDSVADPSAAKEPLADGNHVYNGGFDLGTMDRLGYWTAAPAGSVSVDAAAREARMHGSEGKPVSLEQSGLNLLQSDDYELTFLARASAAGRSLTASIGSGDGSAVFGSQAFELGSGMGAYKLAFTMPAGVTDAHGKLRFLAEAGQGDILLDSVRLVRTSNRNVDYSGVDLFPLKNGGFDAGFDAWEPFQQGAQASFAIDHGAARIDIANAGQEAWNVMLNQGGMNFSKGLTYRLEFDARASEARGILATLENGAYTRRFDSGTLPLSTEWQHFSYDVKISEKESLALKFQLGKLPGTPAGSHQVWIDNVVLEVANAPVKRPPLLIADQTGNTAGALLELTFADDAAWRAAVAGVAVNNRLLEAGLYELLPGVLKLLPGAVTEGGTAAVTVKAAGYGDAAVQQPVKEADGNLLANGSFSAKDAGWIYWKGDGGNSEFSIQQGTAQAVILNNGGIHPQWNVPVSWSAQLIQENLQLKAGRSYELSFRAWADADRPIAVEWDPGKTLTPSVFRITGDDQAVYRTVIKPGADIATPLKFLLGNVIDGDAATPSSPHTVWLDDIAVREIAAAPAFSIQGSSLAGQAVTLAFADDPAWRQAVSALAVNGAPVPADAWTLEAGKLTLAASLFPQAGAYRLTVEAAGHAPAGIVIQAASSAPNVAAGKPASASSAKQAAANAVDGDSGTRWESDSADPQWIAVDLGGLYRLDEAVLHWEGAFAKSYRIQVSSAESPGDGDWTVAYAQPAGNGGVERIALNGIQARHVRVYGLLRGTQYGYSLWELEVFGNSASS